MKFSVIIPTHNEGSQIASALRRLRTVSIAESLEIILVDGGSDDGTVDGARGLVDELMVQDSPNRGAQWHAGAMAAHGDLLLFLTPDAQLPGNWQQALEHFWLSGGLRQTSATVFTVYYGADFGYRLAGALANMAADWGSWPGGEHGLCTTPDIYRRCGGIPSAGREEMVFARRLNRLGPIVRLSERIHPAGRRLRRIGPWAAILELAWMTLRSQLPARSGPPP